MGEKTNAHAASGFFRSFASCMCFFIDFSSRLHGCGMCLISSLARCEKSKPVDFASVSGVQEISRRFGTGREILYAAMGGQEISLHLQFLWR